MLQFDYTAFLNEMKGAVALNTAAAPFYSEKIRPNGRIFFIMGIWFPFFLRLRDLNQSRII
ncbi:MAG: hypothetical protein IJT05_00865, partial [Lachnospiraceae bacterium]|nr:hypothetical protein [Lachnospiraceae bacterium]